MTALRRWLAARALRRLRARLAAEGTALTHAQMGEDIVVEHLLRAHVKKPGAGFYVDIGAFHPLLYSNTRSLAERGWRGLNVDANADAIALFRVHRPGDINVCAGVGAERGALTYHRFAGGAANTFSAELAARWQAEFGWKLLSTETIEVRPTGDILAEYLPTGVAIDYLNVDVEGLDAEIIRGLDLERYRPKIITVELHDADRLHAGAHETVRYLVERGYALMAINLMTFIFLDRAYLTSGATP